MIVYMFLYISNNLLFRNSIQFVYLQGPNRLFWNISSKKRLPHLSYVRLSLPIRDKFGILYILIILDSPI